MKYVKYSINELMAVSEDDFISALFEHTQNRPFSKEITDENEKIDSWEDCLSFLKQQLSPRLPSIIGDVFVCFEYQIFDGTWIDAIVVCENKVIILEFKSGSDCRKKTLEGHRSQIMGYYNKITRCNRVIWEEKRRNTSFVVEKYLVYTNALMKGKTEALDYIKVTDEFQDVIDSITVPASKSRVEEILEFEEELDITTTGVMRDILNRKVLSEMYVQDDSVTACANIIDKIQNDTEGQAINIIFIKGAPGTGKTGTGFSLLEKYMDKGAKYVTGNGNLTTIFSQMIKKDDIGGAEAAVVGSLHDIYNVKNFCKKHHDGQKIPADKCNNKILIIDEAQRVWNPIQIATARKNKLSLDEQAFVIKKEISEAMLVLRAILQSCVADKQTRTVVFLMGSGQEIYIGEEDGEQYIKKAVEHIKSTIGKIMNPIDINIYVPTEDMKAQYESAATKCEVISDLLLKQNKRNEYNDNALNFVNELIDAGSAVAAEIDDAFYIYDNYDDLMSAVEPVNTGAFSIGILGCAFDTHTKWKPGPYGKKIPVQYLGLSGREVSNIDNSELMSFYIDKTSNALDKFASQFNCQGLELDYSIMIWGSMMQWRTDHWELSKNAIWAIDNYVNQLENLKIKYPSLTGITVNKAKIQETFIKNSYRVLLTRARISTYIYIEDKETYDYIKGLL